LINKIRFKLELLFHYFNRYFFVILAGAIAGSSLIIFSPQLLFIVEKLLPSPVHTIGIEGLYPITKLPSTVTSKISYGLTEVTDNNRPQNSPIVKDIQIKDDHKQYSFHLNLFTWHSGAKFTAQDIVRLYKITNATLSATSPDTLVINLKNEFSPLLSILSQPLINPNLDGLGPNKVTNIDFQDGYAKKITLKHLITNQTTTFRFYPNQNDMITAFKLGEISQFQTTVFPQTFTTWPKVSITTQIDTTSLYTAIFLNTEKFSKKQFRQSLSYATPKPTDKDERCLGPISPNSWAYNPQIKEYNYNPTRAKELITPEDPKTINLIVGSRDLLPLAETIKISWLEILGINTNIVVGLVPAEDYDAILTFGNLPQDPDQYLFWHSTQTTNNITKLNNSRIDKLLEEGRITTDYQERKRIYFDFQRFLLEESPAIFISFPTIHTVSRVK
jgi:peptide/nickel transport system substrate-binding protein